MKTKEEILKGIEYLFSKINWGASFLDAEAVQVMNSLTRDIQALAVHCDDVDQKTIRAIVDRTLAENDGLCLDGKDEREVLATALTKALAVN